MRPSPKNQKPLRKLIPSPFQGDSFNIMELAEHLSQISKLLNEIESTKESYDNLFDKQNSEYSKLKTETKTEIQNELSKFKTRFESLVKQVIKEAKYIKGDQGEKGDPGSDADEVDVDSIIEKVRSGINYTKIITEVFNLIEKNKPEEVEKEEDEQEEFTLEKFIDLVKTFPDGIFEIKHIKNLEERLRNLGSKIGGGVGGGQGSWKQKQLSGTIDGANKVFTFAGDPPAEYSERVFLNYIEQNPFLDYSISGTTVTYTTAPDISLVGLPHIIRFM